MVTWYISYDLTFHFLRRTAACIHLLLSVKLCLNVLKGIVVYVFIYIKISSLDTACFDGKVAIVSRGVGGKLVVIRFFIDWNEAQWRKYRLMQMLAVAGGIHLGYVDGNAMRGSRRHLGKPDDIQTQVCPVT